jgi:hypothetical protein
VNDESAQALDGSCHELALCPAVTAVEADHGPREHPHDTQEHQHQGPVERLDAERGCRAIPPTPLRDKDVTLVFVHTSQRPRPSHHLDLAEPDLQMKDSTDYQGLGPSPTRGDPALGRHGPVRVEEGGNEREDQRDAPPDDLDQHNPVRPAHDPSAVTWNKTIWISGRVLSESTIGVAHPLRMSC